MTARQLSSKLSSFGISSGTIRDGMATAKGYTLERFKDAFARYLPSVPLSSVTPSQASSGAGLSPIPIRHKPAGVTHENPPEASNGAGCDRVTLEGHGAGRLAAGSDVTAWDEGAI